MVPGPLPLPCAYPPELKDALSGVTTFLEHKTLDVPTEVKADFDSREIELYVSVSGNVDKQGEIVAPGAAAKSIAVDGPDGTGLIKGFWNHQLLLGPSKSLLEDSKGLLQRMYVVPGLDVYLEYARHGAAKHGSIG